MIVLGFDTATLSTAVGLSVPGEGTRQARDDPREGEHPGHATRLLAMSRELLSDAGMSFGDLDRVAVGLGPGRFTGLRVGIATARGLAQSLAIDLAGVSSLRTLADAAAEDRAEGVVLAVIDARRGEAFAAAYAVADGRLSGDEVAFPQALTPADLQRVVALSEERGLERGLPWLAVGDGALRYRETLESGGVLIADDASPLHLVQPSAICQLGALAPVAASLADILPDYRRPPDAEGPGTRAALLGGVKA